MSDMIAKQEGARLFLTPASVARKANRYFIILLTLQVYVMQVFFVCCYMLLTIQTFSHQTHSRVVYQSVILSSTEHLAAGEIGRRNNN